MNPEASTIWMWVAINTSFTTVIFLGLWLIERRYTTKLERLVEDESPKAQSHGR